MKILLLQDYLRSGGTERQCVLLANAFAAAGHATTLLTFRPGGALAGTVAPEVTHRALQPFDTRLDWFAPGVFAFCRRHQPDVILSMGRMANCYAGSLQKHLPRTTVIATMRTGKKLPLLYRRSLRLVRHVVANSSEAARVLTADHAVPPEKISVIHNALVFPLEAVPNGAATPPSRPETSRSALRSEHGATPATTVLLCVGMFRPEKNQGELIELAARLPRDTDWQLWLAGEGETHRDCVTLAKLLELTDRVKFLGFQADPTPLYRAADLAVLTSRSESLSNFLIEAQAHGLPIVAHDVGGVRECFQPNQTGWAIPPGDSEAFLAALTPHLHDPAQRAAIAPTARAFARASFAPARQAAHYLDLFARLNTEISN
jgi:glycosyltransferase involved in cell wall biosynthesis